MLAQIVEEVKSRPVRIKAFTSFMMTFKKSHCKQTEVLRLWAEDPKGTPIQQR